MNLKRLWTGTVPTPQDEAGNKPQYGLKYRIISVLCSSLPQLTTKSLVPDLLEILAERKIYNVSHKRWMGIIQAIAQVADESKTVKALLQMMPAKPSSDEEKHLAQVIYAALYSVSRRAGVRVSRDGSLRIAR